MRLEAPDRASCPGCGREDNGFFVDVGALSPLLKACPKCIARHGTVALKDEADRLLAMFEAREAEKLIPKHKLGVCWHCGERVLRDMSKAGMGLYPMLCQACQKELNAIKELNGQLPVNTNAEEGFAK